MHYIIIQYKNLLLAQCWRRMGEGAWIKKIDLKRRWPSRSTVLNVPLSLEYSGVSMIHPQLCIDAGTRPDLRRKSAKIASESTTWLRLFSSESQHFFHTQFCVWNWKQCILRYACGLNYSAHFDLSITQKHIVDFVNHFGGGHFHWMSRMIFIFWGCKVTFKLIYLIANSWKHRTRSAMNFIQLSFDLFR